MSVNPEKNQSDFIQFALEAKVLSFGEFKTKAGRLSPYFFNAGLFNDGAHLGRLGEFYAQRTILKKEVLPEHIAAAVFVILGGDLTLTTGLHIPVDGGVAAAFLR